MASKTAAGSSVNSLQAKIHEYLIASNEAPVPKIKKVPKHLRQRMPDADKYFEPTLLYLGPFHRGKNIPEESKRLKKKIATVFMRAIGDSNRCFETCKKIYDEIDSLMKCYELVAGKEEGSSERRIEEQQTRRWKEESSWMLFEDGCAILYFICRDNERFTTSTADVPVPIDAAVIATEDILKLENQIPYRVLTLLMESAFGDRVPWRNTIDNFIALQILRITPRAQNPDKVSSLAAPVHLLQHLRERLVGILPSRVSAPSRAPSLFTAYSSEFPSTYNSAATSLKSKNIYFKAVPVHFKNNLTNISCDLLYRRLDIPSIAISTFSKSILMNLAADEVSSDIPNRLEISSFLHFIDKLVYSPEDAKVLRETEVIHNSISNDEEAAAFVNDAAALLPTNAYLFEGVENDIQYLYETDEYYWWSQMFTPNLSSPWAFIAFIGGMLVLSSTMLQTYVTIFPVPEELVNNGHLDQGRGRVISYLTRRMFTAVLLPLPLLVTLLWILLMITPAAGAVYRMPKRIRVIVLGFAFTVAFLVIFCYGLNTLGVSNSRG